MSNLIPCHWQQKIPYNGKKAESMDENLEITRFSIEQMIECPQCHRPSPPIRVRCLYCGANLPITAENLQIRKKRKIESWEKAFNIVLSELSENYDQANLREISKFTDLKEEELEAIIIEQKSLPIVRVESKAEAEAIKDKIEFLGIKTLIIPDESLSMDRPPRRLRYVEFIEDIAIFNLFNSNESVEIESQSLKILVLGRILKSKVETIEERKKKTNKLKESFETNEDEILIDIYTSQDQIGYRIFSKGFDFSALGIEKEKLAHRNIPKLIDKFRKFAPHLKIIDDYPKIRHFLRDIWQVEEQKSSLGLKRKSFGGYELMSEISTSNLDQFTKYSRLQNLISQI